MAMFPRVLESYKTYYSKQKLWINVPLGHNILLAFSFAAISYVYFTDSPSIKVYLRVLLTKVLGNFESDSTQAIDPAKLDTAISEKAL